MAEAARRARPTGIAAPIASRSPHILGVRAARLVLLFLATALAACSAPAGPSATVQPIDETKLITLTGNVHPMARIATDLGPLEDTFPLDHLQLVLKRSPQREAALNARIDELHDPKSPFFHEWLSPEQFAASYGPPAEDVAGVTGWLEAHALHVDSVAPSRMFIEFSGSAGGVGTTFHTTIHRLNVDGAAHFANMSEPQIPAALASVVAGVHALHDFMPHPMHKDLGTVRRDANSGRWGFVGPKPAFTIPDGTSTYYAVAPGDFATIYNLNPLFTAGLRGAGQTIAVIEDTNIKSASDVTSFRSSFGLSGYAGTFTNNVHPTGTLTCSSPGVTANEGEAALDAEWAGATAPDAAVELASCRDTLTVFGGLIAIQNLINGANPPTIISVSYGECESENGAAANASYVSTYQQAAAEGISVFVSSGDEGAASCDADKAYATHGIAVSGMASTPYNVAVGGTDFMDAYDAQLGGPAIGKYWQTSNSPTDASAKSYIPEIPWNDSCATQLIYTTQDYALPYGSTGFCSSTTGANYITTSSGSGGPSTYSSQPSWQTGVLGLPTNSGGTRYLPDVSLFAANGVWGHFYVYCMSDTKEGGAAACNFSEDSGASTTDTLDLAAGGTSFAAPALAGIQALINQKMGSRQGNPNPALYALAAQQASGGAACGSDQGEPKSPALPAASCIFNDVTSGDIDLPCTGTANCFGYSAGPDGGTTAYGVLSASSSSFSPAYPAGTGWDYATGLGSVNAYNLVNSWVEALPDAGVDAAVDAATDAHADGSSDAGAGVEASADAEAGSGTGVDSGPDAKSDADADAADSSSAECTPSTPCSIWPTSAAPTGGGNAIPVELGVKVQSTESGYITGVRFYKEDSASTHTVNLWDVSGDLLASTSTISETSGGWQTATFASAVGIQANTTYVASYFMPGGYAPYEAGDLNSAVVSAPLQALASAQAGGNGVYAIGASSSFPGSNGGANFWVDILFSTTAPTPTCTPSTPCSLWPTSAKPTSGGDDIAVELGVKVQSTQGGYITGVRFYKEDSAPTHTVNLWDLSGDLLASTSTTSETSGGWQTATFASAVGIQANTTYVASYFMPGGYAPYEAGGLNSAVVSAPLQALASAQAGGNGVYAIGASSSFPSSNGGANFWVDLLFSTTAPTPTCTPSTPCSLWPTSATPTGRGDDVPVELGVKVQSTQCGYITGVRFYKEDSASTHTVNLWDVSGDLLASTSTTSETSGGWQTATFASAVGIQPNTTYVASYFMPGGYAPYEAGGLNSALVTAPLQALASAQAGGNGVYAIGASSSFPSSNGGANFWVDILFSTTAPMPACTPSTPCSLWPTSAKPTGGGDDIAVELGVKVQSTQGGYITGVRFYKEDSSPTHTVNLWDVSGDLLASTSTDSETSGGWQTATFASAVGIQPNTTYVASYFMPGGYAPYEAGGLNSAVVSAPLQALASAQAGGNGVYAIGASSSFPSSNGGANFWVDVLFSNAP